MPPHDNQSQYRLKQHLPITAKPVQTNAANVVAGEYLPIKRPSPPSPRLPKWLNQQGVTHIIVGGIGHRAIQFFDQMGIKVIAGAPELPVEEIIAAWLDGKLEANYVPCEGHGPYYGEGHGGHENK